MKKNIVIILIVAIISSLAVVSAVRYFKLPKLTAIKINLLKKKPKSVAYVEAYYYFGPGEPMKGYLESLKAKYKGLIKIEYIDLLSKEGEERWKKIGITFPCILINGRNKFRVFVDKQVKDVEFIKSVDMDGSWTKKDLEAALKQEMGLRDYPEQVFGPAMPK